MRIRSLVLVIAATVGWAQDPPPAQSPASPPQAAGSITLRDFSASLQQLSQHVLPAVVQVFSIGYSTPADDEERDTTKGSLSKQKSTASGVIVSADGYIVTNAHVVRASRRVEVRLAAVKSEGPAKRIQVQPLPRIISAKIAGIDSESDLALLKIDRDGLPYLELGDSDTLQQGELVMAFGNPLGLEGTATMGIVSSTDRQISQDDPMTYIQTDAPINPGNSGGPLVNAAGQMVGINTFILSQSGGSEGIGFAIPSNLIRDVYQQLRKEGHVHRGQIGLHVQTITPALAAGLKLPQDWGVLASDVTPGGPAEEAGLKIGDVIVSLNGKPLDNARQLEVNIYRYGAREKVALEVLREKERFKIDVPVEERSDDPERFADMVTPEKNLVNRLGILCIPIDQNFVKMLPDLRYGYGLVVAAGSTQDLTTGTGLQPGDVIYKMNGTVVATVESLRELLMDFKAGDSPVFQIERDGMLMFVSVELE